MSQLTFLSEEPHASLFQSRALDAEWQTNVVTWRSNSLNLLNAHAPSGWFGRTSPASCQVTKDGTLEPFSEGWGKSGMGSHTEFLTLNTSEFHSEGDACLLWDILETGDHLQRYCLSATACKGILRRAEKRGKKLPVELENALKANAGLNQ